jgi:hypothetical protein
VPGDHWLALDTLFELACVPRSMREAWLPGEGLMLHRDGRGFLADEPGSLRPRVDLVLAAAQAMSADEDHVVVPLAIEPLERGAGAGGLTLVLPRKALAPIREEALFRPLDELVLDVRTLDASATSAFLERAAAAEAELAGTVRDALASSPPVTRPELPLDARTPLTPLTRELAAAGRLVAHGGTARAGIAETARAMLAALGVDAVLSGEDGGSLFVDGRTYLVQVRGESEPVRFDLRNVGDHGWALSIRELLDAIVTRFAPGWVPVIVERGKHGHIWFGVLPESALPACRRLAPAPLASYPVEVDHAPFQRPSSRE